MSTSLPHLGGVRSLEYCTELNKNPFCIEAVDKKACNVTFTSLNMPQIEVVYVN